MPKPSTYEFEAIGTEWSIDTDSAMNPETIARVVDEIELFDGEYSRFRPNSLVRKLARGRTTATFTHGVPELFRLYDILHHVTNGSVTPLIGDALESLGYDADYSFKASVPATTKPYSILHHHSQTIRLDEPALIDIGAAGKGYLIDRIAAIVRAEHSSFTIDGSGDIFTTGSARTIGLEHPDNSSLIIGQVTLANGSLCASATNRRAWGDNLHHIIDPQNGAPTRAVKATWIIANTTLVADGLATALFFTDPKLLAATFEFTFVIMYADGSVRYSPSANIEIFE